MAFEKKEGEGSLFYNEQVTERHPIYKGYVVAGHDIKKGEEIPIALWPGKDGSKVAFKVKSEQRREQPPQSISQRAMPKRPDPISSGRNADMDDEIPF